MDDAQENLEGLKRKIDQLTREIQERIDQFNLNRERIDKLMEMEVGAHILADLTRYTAENQKILSDNERALHLQGVLINLFTSEAERMRQSAEQTAIDPDEIFELTISGKLPLGPYHTHIGDRAFLERLLQYWEKQEAYEKCQVAFSYLQALDNSQVA